MPLFQIPSAPERFTPRGEVDATPAELALLAGLLDRTAGIAVSGEAGEAE